MTIIKRDGRTMPFEKIKIALALHKAAIATGEFDDKEAQRLAGIVAGIIEKVVVVRKEPITVEQVQDTVEQVLMAAGHFKTAKAYILYRAEHAKIRKAETVIGVENDLNLNINQLKVIERRYLVHDQDGKPTETPGKMFRRVARTLAAVEKTNKKEWEEKFYNVMTKFEFLPGGRTLNNAGTPQNQLANCFVIPIEDSMEGIFDAVKWTALVHQKGGGTGFDFSRLRPKGDGITKSSGGFATGPVSFMKVFDIATRQVMQGGKQRGANMGILAVHHPDILEFITCKSEEGEISNFNISVGTTDAFMRAVEKDKEFGLINPRTQKTIQNISARMLMDQIVSLAWRTGDPGMIYWDAINRNNPLLDSVGPIYATNPCGEQPLHSFDSCNLGSINLSAFAVKDEKTGRTTINWDRLATVTATATRMLDNVIDACTYPLPQITKTVHQHRRIGLGVMGWADLLLQLNIPYNSDEGVALAKKIMKHVQESSWNASEKLAKEKGAFPQWKNSWFAKGYDPVTHTYMHKKKPRKFRNVAITTIAPTGTISMAADCSSGIEPIFALSYVKNVVDAAGLTYINKYFERALKTYIGTNGEFNAIIADVTQTGGVQHSAIVPAELKKVFVTSHDIDWKWHVRMQAAFQDHTDNAVSKTINFSSNATLEDIRGAYLLAWKLGCKGITVYRDMSKATQVLSVSRQTAPSLAETSTPKKSHQIMQSQHRITPLAKRQDFSALTKQEMLRDDIIDVPEEGEKCPDCGALMQNQEGCNLCLQCGYSKCKL